MTTKSSHTLRILFITVVISLVIVSSLVSVSLLVYSTTRTNRGLKDRRFIHLRHSIIDTRKTDDILNIHFDDISIEKQGTFIFSWWLSQWRAILRNPNNSIFKQQSMQVVPTIPESDRGTLVKSWLVHLQESSDPGNNNNNHVQQLFEQTLLELGLKLGDYIPYNTYIVSGTLNQLKQMRESVAIGQYISWTGEFLPEHKTLQNTVVRKQLEQQADSIIIQRHLAENNGLLRGQIQLGNYSNVPFTIYAQVGKHNSIEHLETELIAEMKKRQHEVTGVTTIVAASTKKIAVGVMGSQNAHRVMKWLSSFGAVHWVESKAETVTHNKYSSMVVQSYTNPQERPLWKRGLTGENQIIGVADTGIDYNHCFFYDKENSIPFQRTMTESVPSSKHRKFAAFWQYMDKKDTESGHGTHVAGTASGRAHPSLSPTGLDEYNALAYSAKLAFLDAGCDSPEGCQCPSGTKCECETIHGGTCPPRAGVVTLPLNLEEGWFPFFYNKGVRVQSNSWGTGYSKDFSYGYSSSSAEIDSFVYRHPDFLPVFASGNSGGEFGYASLTTEAESKNSLAIGASQSMINSFQEAANYTDYTQIVDRIRVELYQTYCVTGGDHQKCELAKSFTPDDCCGVSSACPQISGECCGTQAFPEFKSIVGFKCCPKCIQWEMGNTPTHFSQRNLASFTARGPTLDGRVKPDVTTVGEKILSSKSHGLTEECGASGQTLASELLQREGTSMAAPLAASAAIIVRQFFEQGYYFNGKKNPSQGFKPSAALVKAMLIHSTKILDGMIYLASEQLWWPLQYQKKERFELKSPYMQGFGRIELNNILGEDVGLRIPNTVDSKLNTGQQDELCMRVISDSKPFKVTIVWTDPPSSPASKINLINNLDLVVVSPDGHIHRGNGPNSPVQTALDSADYLNNVEQIVIDKPQTGKYTIVVGGASVPKGPQAYAIVLSGDMRDASGCTPYVSKSLAEVQEQLDRYTTLAFIFGICLLFVVPALVALLLYLWLQNRKVSRIRKMGYTQNLIAPEYDGDSSYVLQDMEHQ